MSIALVVCIRKRAGLSTQDFSRHWREKHAPLIRNCPEFSRHLLRYTQHHLADRVSPIAQMFGVSGDYDGVAVLEFQSMETMLQAFGEPAYREQIRRDEPNFVDLEHGLCFITEPLHVV